MKRKYTVLVALFVFFIVSFMSTKSAFAIAETLTVPQEQIFLIPTQNHNALQIVEVLSIQNNGSNREDIQIPLVPGYENVHVSGYSVSAKDILHNLLTVSKGSNAHATTDVMVAYTITLSDSEGVQLNLRSLYPVDIAQIYLPVSSDSAISAQGVLASSKTATVSGKTFRVFTRPGLFENTDWFIGLQVLPVGTSSPITFRLPEIGDVDSGNPIESIANIVLIVVVLFITVFRAHKET